MVLLGLVLIALGAGLGVVAYLAAISEPQTIELAAAGWTRPFTPLELLAVGAGIMLLVWLGWAAIAATMRRRARVRREEREQERYAELERTHNEYREEQDRRFDEARLREEDFSRREEQIQTRQAEIDLREQELARREGPRRGHENPSAADVTGHDEARVSDGTAEQVDEHRTRPDADEIREHGDTRELRVDEHGRPVADTDADGEPEPAPRRTDDV